MENCRNIFNIAARHGWSVSMENMDGIRFLNFKQKTSSGVPFCFTIEAGDGTAGCIAKEYSLSSVPLFLNNVQGSG